MAPSPSARPSGKAVAKGPFRQLGIGERTCKAVWRAGFSLPTQIQRKAIPAILEGGDVVAMARTGSGKTAAFLLPIIDRLDAHSSLVGCRAVIVCVTRELALQTWRFARQFAQLSDLRICSLIGGGAMTKQFDHLAKNPDVIIACPGRLVHHMVETGLKLSKIEYLVFDEADRLFEMGFADQVRKVLAAVPPSRQCILTSATLPSSLAQFSRAGLREPNFIRLDAEQTLSDDLNLSFLFLREEERIPALLMLIREIIDHKKESSIVFVSTKHHVDYLGGIFAELGIPASAIYGTMDQYARNESVTKFSNGITRVLVVTDVAARGIDIPALDNVIHFNFPASPKLFIHRTGRTARAGRSGCAFSLVSLADLPYVFDLCLFLGKRVLPPAHAAAAAKAKFATMMARHFDPSSVEDDGNAIESQNAEDDEGRHDDDDDEGNFEVLEGAFDEQHLSTGGDISGGASTLRFGKMPPLDRQREALSRLLEEDPEIRKAEKAAVGASKEYNRTKPAASKSSVRRAKEFLSVCGGDVTRVAPDIEPLVIAKAPRLGSQVLDKDTERERANLLDHLRSYRPRNDKTKKFRILSDAAVNKMSVRQFVGNLSNFRASAPLANGEEAQSRQTATCIDDNDSEADEDVFSDDNSNSEGHPKGGATVVVRRRKLSKAERKRRKAPSAATEGSASLNGFIRGDGTFGTNGVITTAKNDFYLSTSAPTVDAIREKGYEMGAADTLDVLPDEEDAMKKATYVRKWNEKRKRYQLQLVDVQGRVVKRKNEAGVEVRGEIKSTGQYQRWRKRTRKRVQVAGEEEDPLMASGDPAKKRKPLFIENREGDAIDAGEASQGAETVSSGEMKKGAQSLEGLTKDLGLIEAVQKGLRLTNKQQRKLKRLTNMRDGIGLVTRGDEELKRGTAEDAPSAARLAKAKKEELKKRARKFPLLRKKLSLESRAKHMDKKYKEMNERGARPRSLFIGRSSGKKGRR